MTWTSPTSRRRSWSTASSTACTWCSCRPWPRFRRRRPCTKSMCTVPAMRRQEMMDARAAVEEILGGKTSCDMLIEGIAFDRGPTGEVVHTPEDLLKPCLTMGKVTRQTDLFNVQVHAASMPPAMLSSFLNTASAANLEVLSCHVDERAAIKIRAVVFRPDEQKLTGADLRELYASLMEDLDVDGEVEVKPLQ